LAPDVKSGKVKNVPFPFFLKGRDDRRLKTNQRKEALIMKGLPVGGYLACLLAAVVLSFSGCATIFQGTSTEVDFSSDPSGAEVYVNGFPKGTTPIEPKLESKKTYNIEFRKEGFETRTYTITNHVQAGWVVLDVLFGLVPVVVDAATGSWYKLDEESVNAVLRKQ
jgi:hypothetical protein